MARKAIVTLLVLMIFTYGAGHARADADDVLAGRPCGKNFSELFRIRLHMPRAYRPVFIDGGDVSINRIATKLIIPLSHSVNQYQYKVCTIKQIGSAHLFIERVNSTAHHNRNKEGRFLLGNTFLDVDSPIAPIAFIVLHVEPAGRQNFNANFVVPLIPYHPTIIDIGYSPENNDDLLYGDNRNGGRYLYKNSQFLTYMKFQDSLTGLQSVYDPEKMACGTIPEFGMFGSIRQGNRVNMGIAQAALEETQDAHENLDSLRGLKPEKNSYFFEKLIGAGQFVRKAVTHFEDHITKYFENEFVSPQRMRECFSAFWSVARRAVTLVRSDSLYLVPSDSSDTFSDSETDGYTNSLTKYWIEPITDLFGLSVHWNGGPCSLRKDNAKKHVKIQDGVSFAFAKQACTIISNPLGLQIRKANAVISQQITRFHFQDGMWYLRGKRVASLPTDFLKRYADYCGEAKALYYLLSQNSFPFQWIGVYPFEPYVDYADCVNNVVQYERGFVPCSIVYKTERALANHLQMIRTRYADYRKIYSQKRVGLPETLKEINDDAIDNKRLRCSSTSRLAFSR